MTNLHQFEKIVRRFSDISIENAPSDEQTFQHPFDARNIHPDISDVSRRLFDDGHYSQATFEAFKLIDQKVHEISGIEMTGQKLMMNAFNENDPKIKLNELKTQSHKDEQSGYKFIFSGSMSAIRNPRGHDINTDEIDTCLDHLSLASVLIRRLDSSVK
jgi:uncharacterized protein (TIGR02391 family)